MRAEVECVLIGRPIAGVPPTREEDDTTILSVAEENIVIERRHTRAAGVTPAAPAASTKVLTTHCTDKAGRVKRHPASGIGGHPVHKHIQRPASTRRYDG